MEHLLESIHTKSNASPLHNPTRMVSVVYFILPRTSCATRAQLRLGFPKESFELKCWLDSYGNGTKRVHIRSDSGTQCRPRNEATW